MRHVLIDRMLQWWKRYRHEGQRHLLCLRWLAHIDATNTNSWQPFRPCYWPNRCRLQWKTRWVCALFWQNYSARVEVKGICQPVSVPVCVEAMFLYWSWPFLPLLVAMTWMHTSSILRHKAHYQIPKTIYISSRCLWIGNTFMQNTRWSATHHYDCSNPKFHNAASISDPRLQAVDSNIVSLELVSIQCMWQISEKLIATPRLSKNQHTSYIWCWSSASRLYPL